MRTDAVIEVLEVRTVDPDEAVALALRPSRATGVEPLVPGGRVAHGRRRLPR
jgi:hypothetical protein